MSKTIDLFPAEIEADGTCVYRPPVEALMAQMGRGMIWLLMEHPHETLHAAALGSVVGMCVYFARRH